MYLLDTNTVIYFCNSKLPEKSRAFLFGIDPAISVITNIELFASAKIPVEEQLILEGFVSICTVYREIDPTIVVNAVSIRQRFKTKLPDAIIAATALAHNLTLITHNLSDFERIEGLQLIDPVNPHSLS
jgi:predicted nucleic acid-binding protein